MKNLLFLSLLIFIIHINTQELITVDCQHPKCSDDLDFVCTNTTSTPLFNTNCNNGTTILDISEFSTLEVLNPTFSCGELWYNVSYYASNGSFISGFVQASNVQDCKLKCTIQDGINEANVGSDVRVKPCTYRENVEINKAIKLLGPNDGRKPYNKTICKDHDLCNFEPNVERLSEAIILPPGICAISLSASNIVVSGFQFGPWIINSICHTNNDVNNITISYNKIKENFGYGIIGSGGTMIKDNCVTYDGSRYDWKIHNNLFSHWISKNKAAISSSGIRLINWNIMMNKIINIYHIKGKRGIQVDGLQNSVIKCNIIKYMDEFGVILKNGPKSTDINRNCFLKNGEGVTIVGGSQWGVPYITSNITIHNNTFKDHLIHSINIRTGYKNVGPLNYIHIEDNTIHQDTHKLIKDSQATIEVSLNSKVNQLHACPQNQHHEICVPEGLNDYCNHGLIKVERNVINMTNKIPQCGVNCPIHHQHQHYSCKHWVCRHQHYIHRLEGKCIRSTHGVKIQGSINDLSIENNTISGNCIMSAENIFINSTGILLKTTSKNYGSYSSQTNIQILNNTINEWDNGIMVFDCLNGGLCGLNEESTINIYYNNIYDNKIWGLLASEINKTEHIASCKVPTPQCGNITAECNYWGSSLGSADSPPANPVQGYNLDVVPFLNNLFWNENVTCVSGPPPEIPPPDCSSFANCSGFGNCTYNCTQEQLEDFFVNGNLSLNCVPECNCNEPYIGPFCNMTDPGPQPNCTDLDDCNGHGECQFKCFNKTITKCKWIWVRICYAGPYPGHFEFNYPPHQMPPQHCYYKKIKKCKSKSHEKCISFCNCTAPYTGKTCNETTPVPDCSNLNNCTGNGICQFNCTQEEMNHCPYYNPFHHYYHNYHNNIICESYCNCSEGYTGPNCDIPTAPNCETFQNCSGNGECQLNGTESFCNCTFPYFGPYCNETLEPDCTSYNNCSGNGICEFNEMMISFCNCTGNFTGSNCNETINNNEPITPVMLPDPDCSLLNNCSGHGVCEFNCTQSELEQFINGTNNILCVSMCNCNILYNGTDCSNFMQPFSGIPFAAVVIIILALVVCCTFFIVVSVDNARDRLIRNRRTRIFTRADIRN